MSTFRELLADMDGSDDTFANRVMRNSLAAASAKFDPPEVYGGGCECWVTPEHMHYVYYGITEPGSALEYNPDCPMHGDTPTQPASDAAASEEGSA